MSIFDLSATARRRAIKTISTVDDGNWMEQVVPVKPVFLFVALLVDGFEDFVLKKRK